MSVKNSRILLSYRDVVDENRKWSSWTFSCTYHVVECLFEFVFRLFGGDMVIDIGVYVVLVFARVARPTIFFGC